MRKLTEIELLSRLQPGEILLPPLKVKSRLPLNRNDRADARIELSWDERPSAFSFVVEAKAQSTPLMVQNAVAQAKAAIVGKERPMIIVPYLSPERLQELEKEQVSGVDLCGNGIVIVPEQICVMRTGQPNRFPDSRPLSNPYRGRSAIVARMLLMRPRWESLKDLSAAIQANGLDLSLPQASKAVQAMEDDLIVSKKDGIVLREPLKLLDKLALNWEKMPITDKRAFRLSSENDWAQALSSSPLPWAVTGESSVARYATFSQAGPRRIAVTNLNSASLLLGGIPETVPNYADIELLETREPGFFFGCEVDDAGIRWASRLQTWLELQSGDARQQDAARDLRQQILDKCKNG